MALIATARRAFDERTLAAQVAAAVVAGLAATQLAWWAVATPAWPTMAAIVGGSAGAALLAVLLAQRARRGVDAIAAAAQGLRRDDAPASLEIPLVESSEELRRASANLRRMVEAARRRERELQERNEALERRLSVRTHELTTLQDLSIGLATKSDIHELVGEALDALAQTMSYTTASLWARAEREAGGQVVLLGYRLGEGEAPPADEDLTGMRLSRANLQRYEQIERERRPLIENRARQNLFSWLWSKVTDDARSSELYQSSRSWMAVPLCYRDDVLGVMRVDHGEPDFFDAQSTRLLSAVGSQTALAMRHARLQAKEREVAVIAERNRIARDLHDAVSQTLFAANVLAGTLARGASHEPPPSPAEVAAQAGAIERLNRGALAEMRLLMFELRPDALRNTPLSGLLQHAVEALACRGDILVDASLSPADALPQDVRVQLYRIAQEALSNVARHSGARHCRIEWGADERGARLRIADDGAGFDVDVDRPGHFGLDNMRSRAQEIGASLSLTSRSGEGTEVRIEWSAGQP